MIHQFPALHPTEKLISASETRLLRQITQHQWDEVNKCPSSTAFGPADIDAGKPSFALEGPAVDAQSSRNWHQDNAKSPSLSVWAVTTQEVEYAGLRSVDDTHVPPVDGEKRSPGHAYVDYRGLERGEKRSARKELLLRALDRGELDTTDKLAG